jgi:hypothetical protein
MPTIDQGTSRPTADSARAITPVERKIWMCLWAATGIVICTGIIALGNGYAACWALAPAAVALLGVRQAWRATEVHFPPIASLIETWGKKALTREVRTLLGATVVGGCYWALTMTDGASTGAIVGILLIAAAGAIFAWEASLVLAIIGGLWWVGHNWHLSIPSAIVIGAVIIALAILSRRPR